MGPTQIGVGQSLLKDKEDFSMNYFLTQALLKDRREQERL